MVDAAGQAAAASTYVFLHSQGDPAGHSCDWNAPILAAGTALGPAPICFIVPPDRQSGTLTLVYNDTLNPPVSVPFALNGAPAAPAGSPPSTTTAPVGAGGGAPTGRYTGTVNGLTVGFTSTGSRITGFSAVGGWTCGNGYSAMSFQLPDSPAVGSDGRFDERASGTVAGAQLTWQVHGRLTGQTATGTLQVQSSQACALYSTPWTARS